MLEKLPTTCRTKSPLLRGTGKVGLSLPLAQAGQDPDKSCDKVEPCWQAACWQAHTPLYRGAVAKVLCQGPERHCGKRRWLSLRGAAPWAEANPDDLMPCLSLLQLLPLVVEVPNEAPTIGGEGVFAGDHIRAVASDPPPVHAKGGIWGCETAAPNNPSSLPGNIHSEIPSCFDTNSLMVDQRQEKSLASYCCFSLGPVSAEAGRVPLSWAAWLAAGPAGVAPCFVVALRCCLHLTKHQGRAPLAPVLLSPPAELDRGT